MKNRIALAEHFATLGFTKGAEVGVFGGYYSEVLCKAMPGLDLTCVDIWGWGKYQRAEDECLARLKPYNVKIIKKYSVEAAQDIADESLDFVYIDAAHDYENVLKDLEAWTPKVRIGGIVSGDDFYQGNSGGMGVMGAVTDFANDIRRKNFYDIKLTNWDLDNPVRDDRQPQFYFVRNK